jgi:hypothetical protein
VKRIGKFEGFFGGRRPRLKRHPPAKIADEPRVDPVGLRPAPAGTAVVFERLRVGDHQLDALGLPKRKREVEAVDAAGLDRDAGRGASLPQPFDEPVVSGGCVVKPALGDGIVALSTLFSAGDFLAGDIDPIAAHVGSGNGSWSSGLVPGFGSIPVSGVILSVVHENKMS